LIEGWSGGVVLVDSALLIGFRNQLMSWLWICHLIKVLFKTGFAMFASCKSSMDWVGYQLSPLLVSNRDSESFGSVDSELNLNYWFASQRLY
jgi:hypothetical protein